MDTGATYYSASQEEARRWWVKLFTYVVRTSTKRMEATGRHGIKAGTVESGTVDRAEAHEQVERWQRAVTGRTFNA
mgnify:CR=1 FL=1